MNLIILIKRIYRIPREFFILKFGRNFIGSERWLIQFEKKVAPNVEKLPAIWSTLESIRAEEKFNQGGDKMSALRHGYAKTYSKILNSFPNPGAILEVGVFTGISIGLWSVVFPDSKIFGLDIDLDRFFENSEALVKHGCFKNSEPLLLSFDCYNPIIDDLEILMSKVDISYFDLIIDDGPHTNEAILKTFSALFPLLSGSGAYVIEDNLSVAAQLRGLAMELGGNLSRKGDLLIIEKY
jgi:hypothetical protein